MENIISESRRQWMGMLDAITDYIFVTDQNGTIVKTNRALAAAFGKHPRELIGMKCHEFYDMDLPCAQFPVKESEMPATVERVINDELYLISSFPFYDNDRLLAVHVMKNITATERLKKQLYYAEKLASLGLLVSGVAHEINNPLTGIVAYTELLRMRGVEETIDRELKKILASAERCKRIIENLLTFARQRTPSKTVEVINDLIDRTVELRAHPLRAHHIEIVRDYEAMQSIYIDSQQLQQAFLNILLNAEQAIEDRQRPGGKITIVTRFDRDNRKIRIEISDNGPGIPADLASKIFDPFFTTKPVGAGTGLGLSIAYGIITEHGGSLRVESIEGQGATFVMEIPLDQNTGLHPGSPSQGKVGSERGN